jgi:hypothetical protein
VSRPGTTIRAVSSWAGFRVDGSKKKEKIRRSIAREIRVKRRARVETQLKARETFALFVGRALERPQQLPRPRVGGWSREARKLRPSPGGRGSCPFKERDPHLSVCPCQREGESTGSRLGHNSSRGRGRALVPHREAAPPRCGGRWLAFV